MKVPNFFRIKSAKEPSERIPLEHNIKTTSDFFKPKILLAREVLPNDDFDIDIQSFCRMQSMPFPTFGRIKFYNRVFYVPNRLIMEGWLHFKEDIAYPTSTGLVKINKVPFIDNATIASFIKSYSSVASSVLYLNPIWSKPGEPNTGYPLVPLIDNTGKIPYFLDEVDATPLFFAKNVVTGDYRMFTNWTGFQGWIDYYGIHDVGTWTSASNKYYCEADSTSWPGYSNICFQKTSEPGIGKFIAETVSSVSYVIPEISESDYSENVYDFMFGDVPYVFGSRARATYDLFISLGYRVQFNTNVIDGVRSFSNHQHYSALKLLAFVKVWLDYYTPSQYQQNSTLQLLFNGVSASGREITIVELSTIMANVAFTPYDRDYFTSAWQNPSSPNNDASDSQYDILDISVVNSNNHISSVINHSTASSTSGTSRGSSNGTPTVVSSIGSSTLSPYASNLSYYILEQLRALTTFMRRHQLAGYRPIDRYLAENGVKLDDDRTARSYYLGSDQYDASVQDIMSTSDTEFASLGDYAGKGIAYGEKRSIKLSDCKENGILIVVSSIIPEIGYVQGVNRENLHLTRLQFFQGDFDNLGTQPILTQELSANGGMKSWNNNDVDTGTSPDLIFGFAPRYMEYKVGADFLTGDFAIPSRRTGMDAMHLCRLIDNSDGAPTLTRGFTLGEQEQYDRIFNNTDASYDHFWMQHRIFIKARRAMKSASEVYEFEHADGREIEIPANGTQLNQCVMDPNFGAAIASAGGNILSSALGINASRKAEDRAFQRSLQMQDRQNAFNFEMWNKTNAYNAPAHQIQLMKEAGLNPAMFTPGASQASEVTASDASVPQNSELGQLYKGLNPASDVITALQTDAQIQKLRTDIQYQKMLNEDYKLRLDAAREGLPMPMVSSNSPEVDENGWPVVTVTPTYNKYQEERALGRLNIGDQAIQQQLHGEELEVYQANKPWLSKMSERQLKSLEEDIRSKVLNNSILGQEEGLMRQYGISPNDKDGFVSLVKVALRDPDSFSKIIGSITGAVPGLLINSGLQPARILQKTLNHIKGYGNSHLNPRR